MVKALAARQQTNGIQDAVLNYVRPDGGGRNKPTKAECSAVLLGKLGVPKGQIPKRLANLIQLVYDKAELAKQQPVSKRARPADQTWNCSGVDYGCKFSGSKEALASHEPSCTCAFKALQEEKADDSPETAPLDAPRDDATLAQQALDADAEEVAAEAEAQEVRVAEAAEFLEAQEDDEPPPEAEPAAAAPAQPAAPARGRRGPQIPFGCGTGIMYMYDRLVQVVGVSPSRL